MCMVMTALAHFSMGVRPLAPVGCRLITQTRMPTPRWESTIDIDEFLADVAPARQRRQLSWLG